MDDLTAKTITAGSSGLLGALLAWAGLKNQIKDVKQDVIMLHKNVRYSVTCDALNKGHTKRLDRIDKNIDTMAKDIKELLKGGQK